MEYRPFRKVLEVYNVMSYPHHKSCHNSATTRFWKYCQMTDWKAQPPVCSRPPKGTSGGPAVSTHTVRTALLDASPQREIPERSCLQNLRYFCLFSFLIFYIFGTGSYLFLILKVSPSPAGINSGRSGHSGATWSALQKVERKKTGVEVLWAAE